MSDGTGTRFLITGGSGFVGWNLCHFLKGRHEVVAGFCRHPARIEGCRFLELDVTSRSQVLDAVRCAAPAVIIHAAALSSPDACEKNRPLAGEINITGTINMLEAARQCNCRLVYVSTDLVFDGESGNYSEASAPCPVNYYGRSKLEAEQLCVQSPADALIVRITLQYGWGNSRHASFSDWLMKNIREGNPVSLFTDQYRTMTYVMDTAQGLELAALKGATREIYHLTGPERISRYDFGCKCASVFNFSPGLLIKSLMSDVPAAAARPRDVSLNGDKFLRCFDYQPRGIHAGIAAMAEDAKGPRDRGFRGPRENKTTT
jgi:dTDP-4-dehydrorhamnose reductase